MSPAHLAEEAVSEENVWEPHRVRASTSHHLLTVGTSAVSRELSGRIGVCPRSAAGSPSALRPGVRPPWAPAGFNKCSSGREMTDASATALARVIVTSHARAPCSCALRGSRDSRKQFHP